MKKAACQRWQPSTRCKSDMCRREILLCWTNLVLRWPRTHIRRVTNTSLLAFFWLRITPCAFFGLPFFCYNTSLWLFFVYFYILSLFSLDLKSCIICGGTSEAKMFSALTGTPCLICGRAEEERTGAVFFTLGPTPATAVRRSGSWWTLRPRTSLNISLPTHTEVRPLPCCLIQCLFFCLFVLKAPCCAKFHFTSAF